YPSARREPHRDVRLCAMADAPTTLVILGASGDLTRRLLLPGLGSLLRIEPDRHVVVLGADRSEMTQDEWRQRVSDSLAEAEVDGEVVERIVAAARYEQTDALDP